MLYYRLLSDCCLMFETGLKDHLRGLGLSPQKVLGEILRKDPWKTKVGDISTEVFNLSKVYSCSSVAGYSKIQPKLITEVSTEKDSLKCASKLLYLITITRNQVAHDIDPTNILYGNVSGCQQIIRLVFLAHLFSDYI